MTQANNTVAIPVPTIQTVPLTRWVTEWRTNPRKPQGLADLRNIALKDGIRQDGQLMPASGEYNPKYYKDEKIHSLQGDHRGTALNELAAEKAINPLTGEVFSTIDVLVYENLTDEQRVVLRQDHGQKAIDRVGLYNSIKERRLAGQTMEKAVNSVRPQFDACYRLDETKRKAIDSEPNPADRAKKYHNTRKGVTDIFQKAIDAPTVLENAYIEKLRHNLATPDNKEVREMSDIFEAERKADMTGKITKSKPGPKFMARWNAYLKAQEEAAKTGNAAKSTSMMNREAVETIEKSFESRLLKFVTQGIRRVNGWDEKDFPTLDKAAVALEAGDTKSANALLDTLVAAKIQAQAAAASVAAK